MAIRFLILFVALCWTASGSSYGSQASMRGPQEGPPKQVIERETATSCFTLAFLGAIAIYQKRISAIGGPDRCGFRPSCSAYGVSALREQGPLTGLLMIGDRQMRCHSWKRSGPDYLLLPNGKLFDPPPKNLVFD